MGFDFSSGSGEAFGNINDVFFKKDGKDILPEQRVEKEESVNLADIAKGMADATNVATKTATENGQKISGQTVIQISKEVIGGEEDAQFVLTATEEKRRSTTSVRNKHFIDLDTGDEIIVLEHTEMYNGTNLFNAKHSSNGRVITYPRSKFVGRQKQFVPKEFYIREAERSIEDTIDKYGNFILDLVKDPSRLEETPDGKYLELMLEEPFEIIGGIPVPDKVQIPVKRMFDLEYKLLMLEYVICLDNKIAALLFNDIWF